MKYFLSLFLSFFFIDSVSAYFSPISEYLHTEGEIQRGQDFPQIQVDQGRPGKQVSISFRGGSYSTAPYQSGILKGLAEFFVLDDVIFLGDSSGSICALAAAIQAATKADTDELFNMIGLQSIIDKENLPFKAIGSWKQFLKKNHEALINRVCPTDQDKENLLRKINGRLCIPVTEVKFYKIPYLDLDIPCGLEGKLVSRFESVDDVIDTMTASCHIPYLLTENFFANWRGQRVLDGGIFLPNPTLNEETCIVNLGVFRPMEYWYQEGNFKFPTLKEAERDYQLGYDDVEKNLEYFVRHGLQLKKKKEKEQEILKETRHISYTLARFHYTRQIITTVYFMFKNIFLSQTVRRDNFAFLLMMYAFWKVSKDIKRYIPSLYQSLGYGLEVPRLL